MRTCCSQVLYTFSLFSNSSEFFCEFNYKLTWANHIASAVGKKIDVQHLLK